MASNNTDKNCGEKPVIKQGAPSQTPNQQTTVSLDQGIEVVTCHEATSRRQRDRAEDDVLTRENSVLCAADIELWIPKQTTPHPGTKKFRNKVCDASKCIGPKCPFRHTTKTLESVPNNVGNKGTSGAAKIQGGHAAKPRSAFKNPGNDRSSRAKNVSFAVSETVSEGNSTAENIAVKLHDGPAGFGRSHPKLWETNRSPVSQKYPEKRMSGSSHPPLSTNITMDERAKRSGDSKIGTRDNFHNTPNYTLSQPPLPKTDPGPVVSKTMSYSEALSMGDTDIKQFEIATNTILARDKYQQIVKTHNNNKMRSEITSADEFLKPIALKQECSFHFGAFSSIIYYTSWILSIITFGVIKCNHPSRMELIEILATMLATSAIGYSFYYVSGKILDLVISFVEYYYEILTPVRIGEYYIYPKIKYAEKFGFSWLEKPRALSRTTQTPYGLILVLSSKLTRAHSAKSQYPGLPALIRNFCSENCIDQQEETRFIIVLTALLSPERGEWERD